MLKFGKAVRLMLVATAPVLAVAQAPQARPTPQPRPAASPAAGPATGAATAPAARPQPEPNSKRFVTSDNFFRTPPKPQPASNPQPTDAATAAQPGASRPPAARNTSPLQQPRPVVPQAIHPAVAASAPVLSVPQPSAALPVLVTAPSTKGPVHEASAAVDYANGQISVTAENAPLGVVLKLISAKTGAVVDLAPELQNEPVVAQLGPSPVREALTALLDSPRVDYIVLGTGDEPGSLQRIVVRTRQSFGRVAMAAIRPPQPKPEEAEEEPKLDENGHLVSSPEQEQRMENWKKAREIQRLAEIKRQEQDRENDKLQPQTEAQPQTQPQPETPQPDNPPQS